MKLSSLSKLVCDGSDFREIFNEGKRDGDRDIREKISIGICLGKAEERRGSSINQSRGRISNPPLLETVFGHRSRWSEGRAMAASVPRADVGFPAAAAMILIL